MAEKSFVLDSYAVLAFLEDSKGQEQVRGLLQEASDSRCQLFMSIVNLGEVLYITERERGLPKAHVVLARIDELPIQVIDADRANTLAAAQVKARWSIAYADCFAVALARLKDAAIVTGDPEFKRLEAASVVSISWLEAK
ncbi:MAG: type II toxin-antitoxin system VapC family toxin [Chloroflexi bacterium]|nr:type II toxin-antitoxin system VapC family toxin [Chloroflexota bacterium]